MLKNDRHFGVEVAPNQDGAIIAVIDYFESIPVLDSLFRHKDKEAEVRYWELFLCRAALCEVVLECV